MGSYAAYEINNLESQVRELEAKVTILKAERDEAHRTRDEIQHQLLNLLAVIHRDGGHYTAEHGVEASVDRAEDIIMSERS